MTTIIDHFLFFSSTITGDIITLDMEEVLHAYSVLRLKREDNIFITDGTGRIYLCVIEQIDKKSCRARILEKKAQEPPKPAMHFFIGLPEKEAFEIVLTGLVPLGVMYITPVECKYCQKKWWAKKWEKQVLRFRKKMITAAKQSWNAWLPSLSKPVEFKTAVSMMGGLTFFADEKGNTLDSLSEVSSARKDTVSCFIGPPGGFTQEELSELKQGGAHAIKLADRRLRTELAATVMAGNIVQKFTNK